MKIFHIIRVRKHYMHNNHKSSKLIFLAKMIIDYDNKIWFWRWTVDWEFNNMHNVMSKKKKKEKKKTTCIAYMCFNLKSVFKKNPDI